MSNRLDIKTEMQAFDCKDRGFYDSLTDQERSKFSLFLMMKWGANVDGSADLQEWYIRAHNERVNQNFFDIGRHPKLQWLLCSTVSPDMGLHRHYYLKAKTKSKSVETKKIAYLSQQYPWLKADELELLSQLHDINDLKLHAQELGWDDRQIKDAFSM